MFLTSHLCAFLLTSSACVSTLSFLSSLLDCQHSADSVSFPFIFIHRQALPDAYDTKRTDCYRRPSVGFPRLARRRSSVDLRCSVSTEAQFFFSRVHSRRGPSASVCLRHPRTRHQVCLCRIEMQTHGRGQRRTPRRRERDVACHRRALRRTRHSRNCRLCRRRRRHLAGRVADDSTTVANRGSP